MSEMLAEVAHEKSHDIASQALSSSTEHMRTATCIGSALYVNAKTIENSAVQVGSVPASGDDLLPLEAGVDKELVQEASKAISVEAAVHMTNTDKVLVNFKIELDAKNNAAYLSYVRSTVEIQGGIPTTSIRKYSKEQINYAHLSPILSTRSLTRFSWMRGM